MKRMWRIIGSRCWWRSRKWRTTFRTCAFSRTRRRRRLTRWRRRAGRRSFRCTQYTEGAIKYLDVIDAQRTVLQSQRAAVQLAGVQAVSTVNLIRALGGGWGDMPAAPAADPSVASR